ncbi:MAG: squalene--hopene cyclase [Deltaproteobacteria bacterium RIFCSPLOWO2_12_FULL_40_28]|nr:MAG: squalene--hopene cyclase [Deltaproteobacteria bacterium RIFCSPHIGHO2_02_FULL_40_28]OGQ20934.1 MAG: squalene--hopene cyclase [Deltaproteobacteria bacterium RIFCSPHIGHO2_12_FULL_40_32]OGQ39335.1 MAG: squalene--hopene cyclase [Deltaproteobacteria bacterium RIFCSPLOWO2_02_FULL_40_36]OGQ54616.1 MAG: squalene--hopene cyclase [Deltaproteobacteria bacterium RIFCSPLOWO2_12_FULL_40_28]
MESKLSLKKLEQESSYLTEVIDKGIDCLFSHQSKSGYWWYTLEANESISAEWIFLSHYLGLHFIQNPLVKNRILSEQHRDGSWALYFDGPGDLSTTIECYLALKMLGQSMNDLPMVKAREFILSHGGISQCRAFTRIHLALFELIPWKACPTLPPWLLFLPSLSPINIYEFSSWARSCIVPLIVILHQKKTSPLPQDYLDELYYEKKSEDIDWSFKTSRGFFSYEHGMIWGDWLLKKVEKYQPENLAGLAMSKAENWIREHIEKTEDIYPALAYGALALSALGYPLSDRIIQKALVALQSFQMVVAKKTLPPLPEKSEGDQSLYQQCCISPVWDTPWAGAALLEAEVEISHPKLHLAAEWLVKKQITKTYGDWSIKNKKSKPGGWSFEFENEYFPDIDDTLQVLCFLHHLEPHHKKYKEAINLGLDWLLGMQCSNGGWAAFDVDNNRELLNHIPFADHKACLDPPTPDITGRMVELLSILGYKKNFKPLARAIRFLEKTQEKDGAWEGRWGVNYLYGTWCVLQGLRRAHYPKDVSLVKKAANWFCSVQRADGGFGESCQSYDLEKFVSLPQSIPSQTAWGLMGLIGAGLEKSIEAKRSADFLMQTQKPDGTWEENHHTGTGFPGHFYIRYHGYRHYFPLLALAKYRRAIS